MSALHRKPLRDLRALHLRAVALVALIAAGIGVYAGVGMARDDVDYSRAALFADLRLADLQVELGPAARDQIPSLDDVPGVEGVALRYVSGGSLALADGTEAAALTVHLDPAGGSPINDVRLVAGHFVTTDDADGVVVERNFAVAHGIAVGDALRLLALGKAHVLHVVGVGITPEVLVPPGAASGLGPATGTPAMIFAPMAMVAEAFGHPVFDNLAIRIRPGADPRAVEEAVLGRLRGLALIRVTPRNEAFASRLLDQDLRAFRIFIPVSLGLLAFIVFLATVIALGRLVQSEQREIGALRALGWRPGEVVSPTVMLGLVLAALAVLPGAGLAYLIRAGVTAWSAGAIGLPEIRWSDGLRPLDEAVSIAFIVVSAAALVSAAGIARLAPSRAIRGEPYDQGFPRLTPLAGVLERITSLGVRSFVTRSAVRELTRRLTLTLLTGAAIGLAGGTAIGLRSLASSLDGLTADLAQRDGWPATVEFRAPLGADEVRRLSLTSGVTRAEPYVRTFARVELADGPEDHVVVGVPPDVSLRGLRLAAGRSLSDPAAPEALTNRAWAAARNLGLGDRLRMRAPDRETTVRIVGFVADLSSGEVLVPLAVAQELAGAPGKASGLLVASARPISALRTDLLSLPEVAGVFGRGELEGAVAHTVGIMHSAVRAAIALQVGIAALVLFLTLYPNLLERHGEYGVLRAIGYRDRTVGAIVMLDVAWMAVLALATCLPLGWASAYALNRLVGAGWLDLRLLLGLGDVASVVIPGLVLLPLAALPGLRAVLKADLPSAARMRAFG